MKKIIYLILISLPLIGCDSVHLEYLWTERHPVPAGVNTPPPIQQKQRTDKYIDNETTGKRTEEIRMMMMSNNVIMIVRIIRIRITKIRRRRRII